MQDRAGPPWGPLPLLPHTPLNHRRLPVLAPGGVAAEKPCAYGVNYGSVRIAGGPEENNECP